LDFSSFDKARIENFSFLSETSEMEEMEEE
jgi:hypothetical protein